MDKVVIYHNTRCSKSRCSLELLEENQVDFEVIEYLKNIPSKDEIKSLLLKLDCKAEGIIRKNETAFKENFKGKVLTEEEWIDAMIQYPKLIQRPIIVKGNKAVIGRPPEKVFDLLN